MLISSLSSPPLLLRTLSRLSSSLLVLALLVLLAWWLARLTAPRPLAELPAAPTNATVPWVHTAMRLFGADATQQRRDDPLLTGIFALADGRGFVTYRIGGEVRFAFVGEELRPGLKLTDVRPEFVMLSEGGIERRLSLPTPALGDSPTRITATRTEKD